MTQDNVIPAMGLAHYGKSQRKWYMQPNDGEFFKLTQAYLDMDAQVFDRWADICGVSSVYSFYTFKMQIVAKRRVHIKTPRFDGFLPASAPVSAIATLL